MRGRNGADTPYNAGPPAAISDPELSCPSAIEWVGIMNEEADVLRWAVICLVISLIAGGLGFSGISGFAKRLSMIFFALFFIGFLMLLGFAYLVGSAITHADMLPALVAIST